MSEPRRIIQVAEAVWPEQMGGSKRLITDIGKALCQRGHDVQLLIRTTGLPCERDTIEGMPVHRYAVSRRGFFRSVISEIWGVRASMDKLRTSPGFDVALVHHTLPGLGVSLSRLPGNSKLFTFLHIPACLEFGVEHARLRKRGPHVRIFLNAYARFLQWAQGRTCRASHKVLCLSEFVRGLGRQLFHLHEASLVQVPYGLDLNRFKPLSERGAIRMSRGLSPDCRILLTVRRLTPRMGIENLIVAFKRVSVEYGDAQLWIAGEGPLRTVLMEQVEDEGLRDKVKFLGFVEEERLPCLYGLADLFIMPTAALEGFGVAAAEAMACGAPVLGAPVGAIPEMVSGIDPCLVCQSQDPESLTLGILNALSSRERLETWGKTARHLAEARFDPERRTDALERILVEPGRFMHSSPC